MNANNGASNSVLHGTSVTDQPTTGITVPAMTYAAAFQQYHQPSLNPQLLLQQQPVAMSSLSIEAAAKQAAARAAEISKLLKGENNVKSKEKMEETSTKRESSVSKSCSQSPSHSRSSKSKSASPIRHRNSRVEQENYSPRDHGRYRSYRHSNYHIRGYDDRREYHRSNYRRYTDHYRGRDYSYYRGGSRSRGRAQSWSRPLRYRPDESLSPRHRHSPSPRSNRNISARDLNRHCVSRSPVRRSDTSSSPCSRSASPRKPVARSLSSSKNTEDGSISSLSVKDNRGAKYHSSGENDSDTDSEEGNYVHMPFKEHLKKSDFSGSSPSSESTSIDLSNERFSSGPNGKKATIAQLASASRSHSSYSRDSEKGSSPRASVRTDYRSDSAVSSPKTSTDDTDSTLHKVDHRSSSNHGDVDDRHDKMVATRGERPKFCDSIAVRRAKENSINPSSSDSHSHSPRCSHPEIGSWENTSDEAKISIDTNKCTFKEMHLSEEAEHDSSKVQNMPESDLPQKAISSSKNLAHSLVVGMDHRTKVNIDCQKWPEGTVTVENLVDKCHSSITEATDHHHEYHGIPSEFAALPSSKVDENMVENPMLMKNHDELEQEPEYHIPTPVRLPDVPWVETAEVTGSPLLYCYPEEKSKQRSRPKQRRRKHGKRHHKKHRRGELEEVEDYRREHRRERKLRERGHRKHHKNGSEKKRKRKHLSTSLSAYEALPSPEDNCEKIPRKRSTGSRKRRRCSPSTVSGSSD